MGFSFRPKNLESNWVSYHTLGDLNGVQTSVSRVFLITSDFHSQACVAKLEAAMWPADLKRVPAPGHVMFSEAFVPNLHSLVEGTSAGLPASQGVRPWLALAGPAGGTPAETGRSSV